VESVKAPKTGHRMQRIPLFALAGLYLTLAACNKPSAPESTSGVLRPVLQSSVQLSADTTKLVRASLEAANANAGILIEAPTQRVVLVKEERMLALDGSGGKSITIPIAKLDGPFTHIATRMLLRRADAFELEFLAKGQVIHLIELPMAADEQVQTPMVELPLYVSVAECDALRLRVRGDGPAVFGRVDLMDVPLVERLPRARNGAELITIGDDLRRGVGLSSDEPLEFTLQVPEGGEVGFSYGWPELLRRRGSSPELSVVLSSPGVPERRHLLPLEEPGVSTRWHWLRIPIGDWAGRTLQVRLVLQSRDGLPALCAVSEPKVHTPNSTPPTVLLVTSDTHRADTLSVAGGRAKTPVLDALAARGVLYERCWSTTNVTLPSHVAMLTGRHPRDTAIVDNDSRLDVQARTLADAFRQAGWQTVAATSAAHLSEEWSGLGQGFDRMLITRRPDRRAGETITYLNRSLEELDGRPLFVWVHLFDVHTPYLPPEGYAQRYYSGDPYDPSLPEPDIHPAHLPPFLPGVRDLNWVVANYDGEATYLDGELARILERPRMRNAIVAFTADHGESFGDHGVWWDHAGLYPQTVNVPLIVAWPGAPAGARVGQMVSNIDVGRTLLDLAGLADIEYPGRNLRRLLEASSKHETQYTLSSHGTSAAITAWPWHLVLNLRTHYPDQQSIGELRQQHTFELYNLEQDPKCARGMASEQRAKALELRAELVTWLRNAKDLGWRKRNTRNSTMSEALRALGYAGDDQGHSGSAQAGWFPAGCTCEACLEAQ